MAAPKPPQTVNQTKRPQRELIKIATDPRFLVPQEKPSWFAEYMGQYSADLERLLDRMQERIEQMEGARGHPQIQANLSMLGNKITDVGDAAVDAPQDVVTVEFLRMHGLLQSPDFQAILRGNLDAGGYLIRNLGNGVVPSDAINLGQLLALVVTLLTTNPPATIDAADIAQVGTENKAAHGDHQHAVDTALVGVIAQIDAGDTASAGVALSLVRGDHQHAVNTGAAGDLAEVAVAADGGASAKLPRADHAHKISAAAWASPGTIGGTAAQAGTFTTLVCATIDTGNGAVELAAGVYTPALTNVANLDASTAYECQYLRVGNVVTVSGRVDVDPTAGATSTQLGIALPLASNLGAPEDCAGAAFASGVASQGAAVLGDAVNNRAQMTWVSADVTNQAMYFTFQYQVI